MQTKPDITYSQSVLIVDDDAMLRVLARSALNQLGLDVHEVENGAEAVALFKKRPFDIVLLDTFHNRDVWRFSDNMHLRGR